MYTIVLLYLASKIVSNYFKMHVYPFPSYNCLMAEKRHDGWSIALIFICLESLILILKTCFAIGLYYILSTVLYTYLAVAYKSFPCTFLSHCCYFRSKGYWSFLTFIVIIRYLLSTETKTQIMLSGSKLWKSCMYLVWGIMWKASIL